MRLLTLSLIASLAAAGAAQAADLAAQKAPAAPAPAANLNWSGPYGGVSIGASFGQTNVTAPSKGLNLTIDNGGVLGGAYAGYNLQVQNYVFGLEGEFNAVSNKQSSNTVVGATFYNAEVYSNWQAAISGRVGFAWKNALIYAAGGYSFLNNGTTLTANGGQIYGNTQSLNGFAVGGGLEYALTANWAWRLDYRYYGYDRVSNNFFGTVKQITEYPTANTVRIGATYRWFPVEAVAETAKY